MAATVKMEDALDEQFVEGFILEKMNPEFGFANIFKKTQVKGNATSFTYYKREKSHEDAIIAGELSEPVELGEGSNFPEISVSGFSQEVGDFTKFGFQMRFTEELREQDHMINTVLDTYEGAVYAMLRKMNRDAYNNLVANAQAATITLNDGSWDTSEKIDQDIDDMQKAFDVLGYNYNLTDMYVGKDSWYGAKSFYKANSTSGFTPNDLEGSALHKVLELNGGLIGLDQSTRIGEWFYRNNGKHSSIEDSFIQVHRYEENKSPFDYVIQVWAIMGLAIYKPQAILYQAGV